MAVIFLATAIGASGGASAASKYSPQDIADAKCVASFAYSLGNMPDEATSDETAGVMGFLFYFMGKLKGRDPKGSLASIITPEMVQELEPNIQNEINRCQAEAADLIADLESLQVLGN